MNNQLIKQLVKTRRNLREKYKTLKADILKSQSHLEKTYHPITKPLKQLIETIEKTEPIQKPKIEMSTPKPEFSLVHDRRPKAEEMKELAPKKMKQTPLFSTETVFQTEDEEEEERDNTLPGASQFIDESIRQFQEITRDDNAAFVEYLQQFDALPRIYIKEGIQDTEQQFDHRFGVYHDLGSEKFSIGDSPLTFSGPDILIQNIRYKGTPGLYELLFKNHPIGYNKQDEKEYFDILKRTNALHTNYDSKNPLQRATKIVKDKFQRVIEPYLGRPRSGSASTIQTRGTIRRLGGSGMTLMDFNKLPIEYKHFDDYNEIIDRLRLLIGSQNVGNNSHNNEIISIIEELKEANIIK